MASNNVELAQLPSRHSQLNGQPDNTALNSRPMDPEVLGEHNTQQNPEFSLPPTDEGKDAWIVLATCFVVECFVYGFPFSYGVFQEYYTTHEPFKSKPAGIAAIGTTALGVMYLDSIFIFMFLQRFPNLRRTSCFVGVFFIVLSLLASSFANSVWQLILTQGILYAIGGSLLYNPILLFLDEWFVRRKGIAFGIMWAGTGASGAAIPFLLSWGLNHFSLATILRMWSVIMGVFLCPLLFFVKPRIPVTMSSTDLSRRRFDFRFVYSPSFIALQAGSTFQGLGYFIPGIYLPSYAQSVLGLSSSSSTTTATLALLNTMGVFGCIAVGFLIDRIHVTTVTALFSLGSIISVIFVWGFSSNAAVLLLFSALYGFFAGSFTTTYTGVVREVRKQVETAETGLVIGMLCLGRGIGSVVAGPISERLLKGMNDKGDSGSGFHSGYEPLIFFTGACLGLGGISFGARKMGWFD